MLRTIKGLLRDNKKKLRLPIFLMVLDAIGSVLLYVMLYFTIIHILQGTLPKSLVITFSTICLITVILRLIVYRNAYYLSFARGADICSQMRLNLANHYRHLSLGYFQDKSSGYLLSTLTKDLNSFELIITHTLPSMIKTLTTVFLILIGTFFINWQLALVECIILLLAYPFLRWGNNLVEKFGTQKRNLNEKMVSIVLEYVDGMKVFKSANMTSTHFSRMTTH
ncbi:MAG: ABC transporter transmembrane domain-containing protein [Tissierellia bacterium]|nr:ABC transporter transmembrane domain-containing protein [Tissierellia bacterium]